MTGQPGAVPGKTYTAKLPSLRHRRSENASHIRDLFPDGLFGVAKTYQRCDETSTDARAKAAGLAEEQGRRARLVEAPNGCLIQRATTFELMDFPSESVARSAATALACRRCRDTARRRDAGSA